MLTSTSEQVRSGAPLALDGTVDKMTHLQPTTVSPRLPSTTMQTLIYKYSMQSLSFKPSKIILNEFHWIFQEVAYDGAVIGFSRASPLGIPSQLQKAFQES